MKSQNHDANSISIEVYQMHVYFDIFSLNITIDITILSSCL